MRGAPLPAQGSEQHQGDSTDTMNPKKTLHVGGPNIGDRELFDRLVDEIFERRWFTNGGVVEQELERQLCQYLSVKHCIPVCNATVGLQLVCHALELTGEVIMPAFTFVATPHAAHWEGLTPVFADVDIDTHTLCPASVESQITDRTSAIIGVHVWGQPCMTDQLQAIAHKHDLELIYDAAHAFGCGNEQQLVGNFGRCEVFSFHATKFFNTFEGGAITTNDDRLAEKIRLMKNFGFSGVDNVVHLGTNAKMSEISAAMGLSVLARLDQILEINRVNYQCYQTALKRIPGVELFSYDHLSRTNWQYIVVKISPDVFGSTRDQVVEHLFKQNIRARKYFFPGCHRMEPYRSSGANYAHLVNTDSLCENLMCLPTGSMVSTEDVDRICGLIRDCKTE